MPDPIQPTQLIVNKAVLDILGTFSLLELRKWLSGKIFVQNPHLYTQRLLLLTHSARVLVRLEALRRWGH